MDLTCPKCQAPMRSYERSGVTVDQCTECRGIFLDRGEMERLIDADNRFHDDDDRASRPAPPAYQQPPQGGQQYQEHYQEPQYGGYGYGQKPRKKRKSFMEDLFD